MKKGKPGAEKYKDLRAKAEKALKKKIAGLRKQAAGDPEKVLHELQVHQIELEMQNEELRRAQEDLEESRNKYSDLYDFAPVGYFTFDKNGVIVEANLAGCGMLGVKRAALINKPFHTFVDKDSQDAFYLHRQHVTKTAGRQTCEVALIRKDGEKFNALLESLPAADAKGNFTLCRTTITDVTERKKAQDALRESEQRYRTLMNLAPDAIFVHRDGRIIYCNEASLRLYGAKSPDQLIGKKCLELIHPDEREIIRARIQSLEQGQKVQLKECRHIRLDGSEIAVETIGRAVDWEGKPAVQVIIRDISQRKRIEDEIRKLASVVQHTSEFISLASLDDKIIFMNDAGAAMLGIAADKLGKTNILDVISDDFSEKVKNEVLPTLKKKGHWQGELQYKNLRTGKITDVYATTFTINDPDSGKPLYLANTSLDITARKQAEEQLKRLAEELQRSNKGFEEFAKISSHDLHEPLRAVVGFVQLLDERYSDKLDDKAKEYIKFATDGAKRMDDLITGLLSCARVQTLGETPRLIPSRAALREALKNLANMIENSQAVVTSDEQPDIKADGRQFTQLLQNLIDNAIKFRSDKKPEIHIGCKKTDSAWEFYVRDNGIGIDQASQGRIFKIFQRLHPREQYPGLGVGLTIAQKIVERHGGRIWVESQPGQGATFFFTIPAH